jgi:hypothetical protein
LQSRGWEGNLDFPWNIDGAVAQLGERRVRNAEVEGSIPFRSTGFHDTPPLPQCKRRADMIPSPNTFQAE